MPRIIGQDSDIIRKMFLEASQAVGCTAVYRELKENHPDLYNDIYSNFHDPIVLEVMFDENPKVRVLKDLGWFNEDEEIRPLLIYLPIYKDINGTILNVQEKSLIEIVYMGINKRAIFRISQKRLDSLYGNYWVCKCVPERQICFTSDPSDGYDYLDINRDISSTDDETTTQDTTINTNVEELDIGTVDDNASLGLTNEDSANVEDFFGDNQAETKDEDSASGDDYSSLVMS